MSDHDEIRGLVARYARALDRLDEGLLRGVFAPDGVADMGAIYRGGVDGFVPVAMGFMRMFAATRHEVTTTLIDDAGGGMARVEAYVQAWHRIDTTGGTRVLSVLGRYLIAATRTPDGWRIASFAEVVDWGEERAADPAWYDGNTELPKGRRDRSDPSYVT